MPHTLRTLPVISASVLAPLLANYLADAVLVNFTMGGRRRYRGEDEIVADANVADLGNLLDMTVNITLEHLSAPGRQVTISVDYIAEVAEPECPLCGGSGCELCNAWRATQETAAAAATAAEETAAAAASLPPLDMVSDDADADAAADDAVAVEPDMTADQRRAAAAGLLTSAADKDAALALGLAVLDQERARRAAATAAGRLGKGDRQ